MIICQCNTISEQDIRDAVDRLLAEMPQRVVTPGLVYRSLGKRGRCCGCFPYVIDIVGRHLAQRADVATDEPSGPG